MKLFAGKKQPDSFKETIDTQPRGGNMRLFKAEELKEERLKIIEDLRQKQAKLTESVDKKTKELNERIPALESEYREKKNALDFLKAEHEAFLRDRVRDMEVLESRRQDALKPIETERRELEDKKLEIGRNLLQLGEEQLKVASKMETLRREQGAIELGRQALERTRLDTLTVFEDEKAKARQVIEESRLASERLKEEREKTVESIKEAQDIRRIANLAEANVRAAMLAADRRIAEEKKEQQKTDDKRMALKSAIDEMKRRGLWNKSLEKKVN